MVVMMKLQMTDDMDTRHDDDNANNNGDEHNANDNDSGPAAYRFSLNQTHPMSIEAHWARRIVVAYP